MVSKVVFRDIEEMVKQLHNDLPWWKKTYYAVYRFCNRVFMVPKEINWFIQRGRRGYSDRDTWNLQWYLAWIISNGTKQLKEEQHGYPGDLTKEEWDTILDKISLGFGKIVEAEEGDFQIMMESLPYNLDVEEAKQLFIKHLDSLWD